MIPVCTVPDCLGQKSRYSSDKRWWVLKTTHSLNTTEKRLNKLTVSQQHIVNFLLKLQYFLALRSNPVNNFSNNGDSRMTRALFCMSSR